MKFTCFTCGREFVKKPSDASKSGKDYCSRKCHFDLTKRFWSRVHKTDGCWPIAGYKTKFGYSWVGDHLAHRFSWILHFGAIPNGLCVLHKCDNPPCVNPAHLFLGTIKDNQSDAAAKGRFPSGERHHNAKLSQNDVCDIRKRYSSGERGYKLAKEFSVSGRAISAAVNNETWKSVEKGYVPPKRKPRYCILNYEDVEQIRQMHRDGVRQSTIAKVFDVTQGNISRIVRRLAWK